MDKRAKLPDEKFNALAAEQIPDEKLRGVLMQIQAIESIYQIETLATSKEAKDALDQLRELFRYLDIMGVGEFCEFDIKIVRGLAYYTGPVFEIYDRSLQLRALCGGGRYDNLLAGLGGQQVPATGFGMGDVVLEILLAEKNLLKSTNAKIDFFVINADDQLFDQALALISQLRTAGFSATISYKRSSIGKLLKQASTQNARFAVILGEETIDKKLVTVKNMADGSQKTIDIKKFLTEPLAQST